MNNSSRKEDNRPRRQTSIDGVSNRPLARFNQGRNDNFGNRQTPLQQRSANQQPNVLSDFKRSEGFHPNTQQPVQAPESSQNTLVIDRNTTPKRTGLFRRKKNPSYNLSPAKANKLPVSRKKKVLRVSIVLLIILMLVLGFLFAKGYITLRKILPGGGGAAALQQNVEPSKLNGEGDGRVNILLLGRGGEGHEGADLTDTIIIASIDPIAKEASLLSVPRDLYVPVQRSGSMKVNAVFASGKNASLAKSNRQTDVTKKQAEADGFSLLETTLETTLGLPIHYHVIIDFEGFKQAIDTVGGVRINAPLAVLETLRIDGRNYRLDVQPGEQQMDGFEALAYARSRYTSPRGDFDRAERQRIIINALKDKILSAGTFGNPQKISDLLGNFGNHVQTNFSTQDLQRLYNLSKEIPGNKIGSIGLADPPNNFVTTSNIGGASVVIPTAGANDFKAIQSYLRNSLKDSYLKNENATVIVLNGTSTSGLATQKAEELRSFGYSVSRVDNAPTRTYPTTVIVDLRSGSKKYTQNYLEKRFGVSAVNSLPDPAIAAEVADFVIILGSDQS